jgi:hypothetical protein
MKAVKVAMAATAILLGVAIPASAVPTSHGILASAGQALHNTSVYVAPGASPALTSSEVSSLQKQIAAGRHPVYIAVLPEAVKNEVGTPDHLIPALIDATRLSGVYAASAGPVFRAGESSQGGVPNAATYASNAYNDAHTAGLYPMLKNFVTQVEGAPVLVGGVTKKPSKPFPWLAVFLPIGLVLLLLLGAFVWWRRRKQAAEVDNQRGDLTSKIYSLQGKINGITDIGDTAAYNAALDLVQRAAQRAESATTFAHLSAADALYEEAFANYRVANRAMADTAATTKMSTPKPGKVVPKTELPEPTQKLSRTQNEYRSGYDGPITQSCYPGYGYGYYPGYGYGYIGFDGNFMMGVLEGELLAETFDNDGYGGGDTYVDNNNTYVDSNVDTGGGGDYSDQGSYDNGVDSGGGGDWSDSSADSGSTDSGYDSGGGGGYDGGGDSGGGYDGGGGGDFGGGGDSGGGGDF